MAASEDNLTQFSLRQSYIVSYTRYGHTIRQMGNWTCDENSPWSWQDPGECDPGGTVLAGNVIGVISVLMWFVGIVGELCLMHRLCRPWMSRLIISQCAINMVSGLGTVLSMQIPLVILYELFTIAAFGLTLLVLALGTLCRWRSRPFHYQRVCGRPNCKSDDEMYASTPQKPPLIWLKLFTCCCLPLCLLTTFVLLCLESQQSREFHKSWGDMRGRRHGLQHEALLVVTGYTFGCLACCAHWCLGRWKRELFKLQSPNHSSRGDQDVSDGTSAWYRISTVNLLLADIIFVVAVLLHARGIWLVMSSLPWLVSRIQDSVNQIMKILARRQTPRGSYYCEDPGSGEEPEEYDLYESHSSDASTPLCDKVHRPHGEEDCKDTVEDLTEVTEDMSGSGLSGPDSSIWYHSTPPAADLRGCPDIIITQAINAATATMTITTDDSETTISQEAQVLEYSNFGRQCPPFGRGDRFRLAPLNFNPQATETYHQRVKKWIVESTPEEETPPSLTMTLNLDSSFEDDSYESFYATHCGRKVGSGVVSQRKNSF